MIDEWRCSVTGRGAQAQRSISPFMALSRQHSVSLLMCRTSRPSTANEQSESVASFRLQSEGHGSDTAGADFDCVHAHVGSLWLVAAAD